MDEWAVHVTPEVIRAVLALLIDESQPAPDHLLHQSYTRPAQVSFIHYLYTHQLLKRVLCALLHLVVAKNK